MRKSLALASALASVLLLSWPHGANAQQERSFTIVNTNASVSIQRVWTATAGTNDAWREANMDAPIRTNSNMRFTMGAGATCFIDVKVQFSDNYEQTFGNINVCRGGRVVAQ